jgi:uncharacterized membrane protein
MDRSLPVLTTLTTLAALGCGVVGGVFFTFSVFVMKALDRLPPSKGIPAMQSINTAAPTPWFMAALFGTGLACVALAISALFRLDEPDAVYHLVGGALYLVTIVLTIVFHIPRNDALAIVDPDSTDGASYWSYYLPAWTTWNHVRTFASVAAAAALTVSLRVGAT